MSVKLITNAIIVIGLVATAVEASAQRYRYCEVVLYETFGSSRTRMAVDSGQYIRVMPAWGPVVRDSVGRAVNFDSRMAAINYLSKRGWELFQVYSKQGGERLLLRKEDE